MKEIKFMFYIISIFVGLWVLADALNKKIKYSWLYSFGVGVFIFIGLPIYIARRQLTSDEKLLKKIVKPICFGLITFALLVLIFFNFKERDTYRCNTCFAKKDAFQWRLGQWGGAESSIPLSNRWEVISETNFLKDFIGETGHQHDWNYAQGSPYYFFGLGGFRGCAIGGGRHISDHCREYGTNQDYRIFIHTKLNDGSLTKTKFFEYFYLRNSYDNPALDKESYELTREFSWLELEQDSDIIARYTGTSNSELSKKYRASREFRAFIQTKYCRNPYSEMIKIFSEAKNAEDAITLKKETDEVLNQYQNVISKCGINN